MLRVDADPALAELVMMDVVDVRADGTFALNARFVHECRAAYDADPSRFDEIVSEAILARAISRGFAVVDLDDLTIAALEIAANEAERVAEA